MKQRSQSVAHGAVREPQARQRPIVGSSISARSSWTTRAAAVSSSAAAFSIVTPATPGYCSANQRRIDASRAACSASRRLAAPSRCGSRIHADDRALRLVAGERARERAEQVEPVLVDRRLHELPHVGELEPPAAWRSASRTASRRASSGGSTRPEPALDAPVAQRGVAPRVERRLELVDARHVQVGELRAQPAGVDDAVAAVAAGQLDVRRQRGRDELRTPDAPTARR